MDCDSEGQIVASIRSKRIAVRRHLPGHDKPIGGKGERGLLVGYVTMNTRDRDEGSVAGWCRQLVDQESALAVTVPA